MPLELAIHLPQLADQILFVHGKKIQRYLQVYLMVLPKKVYRLALPHFWVLKFQRHRAKNDQIKTSSVAVLG